MGRQSSEMTTVTQPSSIALLQERFRRLERVRELREEREQKRQTSPSDRTKWYFFHPDLVRPSRPLHGCHPFSDQLNGNDGRLEEFLRPKIASSATRNSSNANEVDVDTSLHL